MSDAHLVFDESFKRMLIRDNRSELSRYRNVIIDELKRRGKIGQDRSSPSERVKFRKDLLFTKGLVIGGGIIISFIVCNIMMMATKDGFDFEEAVCGIAIMAITWIIADYIHILYGHRIAKAAKKAFESPEEKTAQQLALQRDSTELLFEKKRCLDEKLNL